MTDRLPTALVPAVAPDEGGFPQKLDEDRWLAAFDVPGVAVALVRDARPTWSKGYGQADVARGVAVTPDTVFQVGSISKSVTAWGVMRLVQQRKLDLDAPVERYLTRWHLPQLAVRLRRGHDRAAAQPLRGAELAGLLTDRHPTAAVAGTVAVRRERRRQRPQRHR